MKNNLLDLAAFLKLVMTTSLPPKPPGTAFWNSNPSLFLTKPGMTIQQSSTFAAPWDLRVCRRAKL